MAYIPLSNPKYNNPPAYMGYVGFVRFLPTFFTSAGFNSIDGYIIRAKSADINVKQDVTKPEVIDSRFDRTVYQLGPKEIDGTIEFPAVYEASGGKNIVECLYKHCIYREDTSLKDFNMDVKYASSATAPQQAEFSYNGCVVNSFTFSVAQSAEVDIRIEVIGLDREYKKLDAPAGGTWATTNAKLVNSGNKVGNTRIVTWNDARVELLKGSRGLFNTISGQYVRSFEATINNNAERFYTLNGQLFPQAIAPKKRDITGKIVLMGRHSELAALAWENEKYSSEDTFLKFGFVGRSNQGISTVADGFGVTLPNIICQIEEMSLTNELFETTVNWSSLPAATTSQSDYLYTQPTTTFSY
jgi:hypothetical protein